MNSGIWMMLIGSIVIVGALLIPEDKQSFVIDSEIEQCEFAIEDMRMAAEILELQIINVFACEEGFEIMDQFKE